MRYALLIYEDPSANDGLSASEAAAITDEYMTIRRSDAVTGGAHLQPVSTATTVRVQDGGSVMTDGPFADTKEVFGGFFLVDADDLDGALAVAQRVPAARRGGAVEVRPLSELPD